MTSSLNDKLKNDITHRYALFSREEDGHVNTVIDSFMPNLIAMKLNGQDNRALRELRLMPSTKYAISEYFANMTSTRQLPIQYMVEMLGFKKAKLKSLLLKVKSKKQKMIMVGFGGTNANTWWWLSKMAEWTGIINIFDTIAVVDDDSVELHNILRFPFDLNNMSGHDTFKTSMFNNHAQLTKKYIAKKDLFPCSILDLTNEWIGIGARSPANAIRYSEDNAISFIDLENTFIFGAPTIRSRSELYDMKFIAATHGDNHCSMTICPEVDNGLLTESYGMIRLNTFFMNHVRMAIGLLEFIASDDPEKWAEKNKRIFEYNFKKAVDNNELCKTEKNIFFHTEHSGNLQDLE